MVEPAVDVVKPAMDMDDTQLYMAVQASVEVEPPPIADSHVETPAPGGGNAEASIQPDVKETVEEEEVWRPPQGQGHEETRESPPVEQPGEHIPVS